MINQQDQRKPIRIGIADKSPLMRAALKQLFSEDERFEIVSASENSEAFLKILNEVSCSVLAVKPGNFVSPVELQD